MRRGEVAAENNARSVLVPPQGRRRRVLLVEGAPGFEHTFLKRALARDPASKSIRWSARARTTKAATRSSSRRREPRRRRSRRAIPLKRAELFAYDAIVFGNIEADFFTREQLEITADFVAARGGGLLVLGARSFEREGLAGTPLEEVLPVDLTDRRSAVARRERRSVAARPNTLALTADGADASGHAAGRRRSRRAARSGRSCRRWPRSRRRRTAARRAGPGGDRAAAARRGR